MSQAERPPATITLPQLGAYLRALAQHHRDAGRPSHAAGVLSALAKVQREVAKGGGAV